MNFKEKLERYEKLKNEIAKVEKEKQNLEDFKAVFNFLDGDEFSLSRHENFRDFSGAAVAGETHEFEGFIPNGLRQNIVNDIDKVIEQHDWALKDLNRDKEQLENSM